MVRTDGETGEQTQTVAGREMSDSQMIRTERRMDGLIGQFKTNVVGWTGMSLNCLNSGDFIEWQHVGAALPCLLFNGSGVPIVICGRMRALQK